MTSLSLDDIRRIAVDHKENWQRKANQAIRKDELKDGLCALACIEAIDQFIYACELSAGAPYRDPNHWSGQEKPLRVVGKKGAK